MMNFNDQDRSYPVGAQCIGAPPIYRPMACRCAPQADNEFYQVTSVIPRRRTMYWRTADLSANGPSMRSPGRSIGDVHDKSAPKRCADYFINGSAVRSSG